MEKNLAYIKKEVYYFIDKDGLPDQRVTDIHPSIHLYVVRVSVLMYQKRHAARCCKWLNEMVTNREGVTDRFKVTNYKGDRKTFIVVRKLLVNDLVRGIDEFVEVKQR